MLERGPKPKKLLSVSADSKTVKGEKLGYLTGILYLAPGDLSGREVCPKRSKGCSDSCLGAHAGRVTFIPSIMKSRLAKTDWYFDDRDSFMTQLVKDINALIRKAKREGLTPVVRLNGSSDIPWERVIISTQTEHGTYHGNIMQMFPNVQFYDYTKRANRRDLPSNYHLTFSLAEDNDAEAFEALGNGMNVAAVFHTVPTEYVFGPKVSMGPRTIVYPVIDGDASDLRFLDEAPAFGCIVGLKAKGGAKADTSGFVR
jgi:hypothetical protein